MSDSKGEKSNTLKRTWPECNEYTCFNYRYFKGAMDTVMAPCQYKKNGCEEEHSLNEIDNHEDECDFRDYKCYQKQCPWAGYRKDLKQHYEENHPEFVLENPSKMKPTITADIDNKYYMSAYGLLFFVHVKYDTSNTKLIYKVHMSGTAMHAKLFEYVLTIKTEKAELSFKEKVYKDIEGYYTGPDRMVLNIKGLLSSGITTPYDKWDFKLEVNLLEKKCCKCHANCTPQDWRNRCFCDSCCQAAKQ